MESYKKIGLSHEMGLIDTPLLQNSFPAGSFPRKTGYTFSILLLSAFYFFKFHPGFSLPAFCEQTM